MKVETINHLSYLKRIYELLKEVNSFSPLNIDDFELYLGEIYGREDVNKTITLELGKYTIRFSPMFESILKYERGFILESPEGGIPYTDDDQVIEIIDRKTGLIKLKHIGLPLHDGVKFEVVAVLVSKDFVLVYFTYIDEESMIGTSRGSYYIFITNDFILFGDTLLGDRDKIIVFCRSPLQSKVSVYEYGRYISIPVNEKQFTTTGILNLDENTLLVPEIEFNEEFEVKLPQKKDLYLVSYLRVEYGSVNDFFVKLRVFSLENIYIEDTKELFVFRASVLALEERTFLIVNFEQPLQQLKFKELVVDVENSFIVLDDKVSIMVEKVESPYVFNEIQVGFLGFFEKIKNLEFGYRIYSSTSSFGKVEITTRRRRYLVYLRDVAGINYKYSDDYEKLTVLPKTSFHEGQKSAVTIINNIVLWLYSSVDIETDPGELRISKRDWSDLPIGFLA